MKTLQEVVDFQKSLNKCCGSCEEDFVLAGFRAAIEAAKDIETRLGFEFHVYRELQAELNRYLAHEKFLRQRAMEKIGL
jgi:hypothetical protein